MKPHHLILLLHLIPCWGWTQPARPVTKTIEVWQQSAWQIHANEPGTRWYIQHFDPQGRHIRTDFSPAYSSYGASERLYSPDGRTVEARTISSEGQTAHRSRLTFDELGHLTSLEFAQGVEDFKPSMTYEYRNGFLHRSIQHAYNPGQTGVISSTLHIRNAKGQLIQEKVEAKGQNQAYTIAIVTAGGATGTWILERYSFPNDGEPYAYLRETYADRSLRTLLRSDYFDEQGTHIQFKQFIRDQQGRVVGDTFHDYRHNVSQLATATLDAWGDTLSITRDYARPGQYRDGSMLEQFTHDPAGRPLSRRFFSPEGKTSYTWQASRDAAGRITQETETAAEGVLIKTRIHHRDTSGRLFGRTEIVSDFGDGPYLGVQPIRQDTIRYRYALDSHDSIAVIYREGSLPESRLEKFTIDERGGWRCLPGTPEWLELGNLCHGLREGADTVQVGDTTRYIFHFQPYVAMLVRRESDYLQGKLHRIREYDSTGAMVIEYDPARWRDGLLVRVHEIESRQAGDTLIRTAQDVHFLGFRSPQYSRRYLNGRLIAASGQGDRRYAYDAQGRLILETTHYGPGAAARTCYTYDEQGRRSTQRDFNQHGEGGTTRRWIHHPDGRIDILHVEQPVHSVTTYKRSYW